MVAYLTRVFGPAHLGLAEEVVQEALVRALQQWPYHGVPDNPGGWLLKVARNAALDVVRRDAAFRGKAAAIAASLARDQAHVDADAHALDGELQDDELRMVFLCCHPSLSSSLSVALALKTAGGFGIAEIARAFLADPTAIAQRLVRAKRRIREQDLPLELPRGRELAGRLDAVLETIYLLFNEGYTAHAGDALVRLDLCQEALRLGRLVAAHPATNQPRVHALVALMAFQGARLPARLDAGGDLLLLADQDPARWDRAAVELGFRHLEQAAEGDELSKYHLEAAIAAVHARAVVVGPSASDWPEILDLYDQLLTLDPSPVIRLNRAVALAKVHGPRGALADEPALREYHLLPAVQGHLFAELGETDRAAASYRRALECRCSEPERRFLEARLRSLTSGAIPPAGTSGIGSRRPDGTKR
jgi:predicted RNA polymerase sigma factor